MSASTRRIVSFLALAVAAGLLFVADGVRYFDRNVLDSNAFAEHATDALEKEAVRRRLVQEIATQTEARVPGASSRRAEIEAAADEMISTPQFQRIFRAGVREIHRLAFDDRDSRLQLNLTNVDGPLVKAARQISPSVAAQIPAGFDARIADVSEEVDRTLGDLQEFSRRAGGLADITLLLGLAGIAASLICAVDRFRALIRVGWVMAAIGLIYLAGYYIARGVAASELENDVGKDAVKGAWDGLLGGLRDFNLGLLIAGLLVVIGAVVARGRMKDRDAQGWGEDPTQRYERY